MAFLVGKGVVGGFVWFGARLWSIEIEWRAGCVFLLVMVLAVVVWESNVLLGF